MSREFKNILIDLVPQSEGNDQPTAAMKMGLALARQSGLFMTIHYLSPRAAWAPANPFTNLPVHLLAEENKRLDEAAKTSLDIASEAAAAAGVPCESEVIALDFLALVGRSTRKAHLQDVVIMDAQSGALQAYREIVQAMLFRSGRPVILVPAGWDGEMPRDIVIAWDGSVPAARAVAEALPFLQKADSVRVVTIQGEKDLSGTAPGDKLAIYLDRHGVRATQENLAANTRDVAGTLRDHVVASGADMVVMGAYAHSRLHEAIVGGVTRSFLDSSPVPLFMAH